MRKKVLAGVLLALVAAAGAQQSGSTSSSTRTQETASPAPQKKSSKAPDRLTEEKFSLAVAEALMSRLVEGLVRKNPKLFLSAFDPVRFPDYGRFADGVTATLDQSRSFRAHYHVVDATEQDGKGIATVQFDAERVREGGGAAPARRRVQMRLDCERGAKGWRIVQLTPGDFLSPP